MSYNIHQVNVRTIRRAGGDSTSAWVAKYDNTHYKDLGVHGFMETNIEILCEEILVDSVASAQLAGVDAFIWAHYENDFPTGTGGSAKGPFGESSPAPCVPDSIPNCGCSLTNRYYQDHPEDSMHWLAGHEYGHNIGFGGGHPRSYVSSDCAGIEGTYDNFGYYTNMKKFFNSFSDTSGFVSVHPFHANAVGWIDSTRVLEIAADTTDVTLHDIRGSQGKLVKIPTAIDKKKGEQGYFCIAYHAGTGADSVLGGEGLVITEVIYPPVGAPLWDLVVARGLFDPCREGFPADPLRGKDGLDTLKTYTTRSFDLFGTSLGASTYNEFSWRTNPTTNLYDLWYTDWYGSGDVRHLRSVVTGISVQNIRRYPAFDRAKIDVFFGPMPDSCSISLSDSVVATCPAMDADSLAIALTLKDIHGNYVDGLAADSIYVVAISDTSGTVASCGSDTTWATSDTDANGRTTIVLADFIGCGEVGLDVCAMDMLIGRDWVQVRSVDTNANCIVGDDGESIPQTSCGDFDNSGGVPDAADTTFYESHFAHSNLVLPDSCSVSWSDSVIATCPALDADSLVITVTLVDGSGARVVGFGADSIWAFAERDSSVLKCRTSSDTVHAEADTDVDGKARMVFADLVGCGNVDFEVYLESYGIELLLDSDSAAVRSVDANANCIVGDYYETIPATSCGDFDDNGTARAAGDSAIYNSHIGHFYVDGGYSASLLNVSPGAFLRYCPEGDTTGTYKSSYFVVSVNLKDGHDRTVPNVPGDSVYIEIPAPSGSAFRFHCGTSNRRAWALADGTLGGVLSVPVYHGGGHSLDLDVKAYAVMLSDTALVGSTQIDTVRSFDIGGSGQVNNDDMSTFSGDYMQYYNFGIYNYRSDFDGDYPLEVDDDDFDFMNHHYKHKCADEAMPDSLDCDDFPEEDIEGLRNIVSDAVLDNWIGRASNYTLKTFLECVRALPEPDSLEFGRRDGPQAVSIELLPVRTALMQNCPNPFGTGTMIKYQVAPPGGHVKIRIFDAAGRLVRTLVDQHMAPGFYDTPWDGRNDNGRKLAVGVYFYQMNAPRFESDKKMIIAR